MIIATLILLALSPTPQTAPVPASPLYTAPAVRPFEPPSRFGRITAEGDGDSAVLRPPIVGPVAVESYRGSYEHAPSGADAAYNAGVTEAERAMDVRMGPMDGRWRVLAPNGRLLMTLALIDAGEAQPLEGAFRTADPVAQVGPLTAAERTGESLVLDLDGRRVSLRASGDGWTGVLMQGGQERAVSLVRQTRP